jgi:hypothetical protein
MTTNYLDLPRRVASLDKVKDFADAYKPGGDGYHYLTPDAMNQIAKCRAEIVQITAQAEHDLEVAKAEEQRLRATAKTYQAKAALREALMAAGCKNKLVNAAIAHLAKEWTFTIEPNGTVLADAGSGQGFIGQMVAMWLSSEEGEAYGKSAPSGGGHFSSLIRQLR